MSVLQLSADELKSSVHAFLASLPSDQLDTVTTKLVLGGLADKYGFSLKARKKEIPEIVQGWAEDNMPEPQAAAEPAAAATENEAAAE